MKWGDIDPRIISMLLDGIDELATWAWKKVGGDGKGDALKEIRYAAAHAAALTLHAEILRQAHILQMREAVEAMGPLSQIVLDSMTAYEASRRTVPPLELIIEEIPEG